MVLTSTVKKVYQWLTDLKSETNDGPALIYCSMGRSIIYIPEVYGINL